MSSIDFLRGIAILGVIAFHLLGYVYTLDALPFEMNLGWRDFGFSSLDFNFFYPLTFGFWGVNLFFVISGFSIHLSFLKQTNFEPNWSQESLGTYFIKRFFRIYPPYLIALVVFVFIRHLPFSYTWPHFLLINNLSEAHFSGINSSFWSIAHEWQYYLLFPVLIFLTKWIKIHVQLILSIGASLAGILWAFEMDPSQSNKYIWLNPLILWFEWIAGMYLAELIFVQKQSNFSLPKLLFAGLVFLGCTFNYYSNLFSPFLGTLFFFNLLGYMIQIESSQKLHLISWIKEIGQYSFGIYLFHQPFIFFYFIRIKEICETNNTIYLLVFGSFYVLLLFFFGKLFFNYVEKPSIKLGERILASMRPKGEIY